MKLYKMIFPVLSSKTFKANETPSEGWLKTKALAVKYAIKERRADIKLLAREIKDMEIFLKNKCEKLK